MSFIALFCGIALYFHNKEVVISMTQMNHLEFMYHDETW